MLNWMAMTPIEPVYIYRATCDHVVDGDTFYLDIDLGFRIHVIQDVRLHGCNAPELSTPEGKHVRDVVVDLMLRQPLIVKSYKERQSFARWVCDVWFADTGVNLSDWLIEHGYAVPMER